MEQPIGPLTTLRPHSQRQEVYHSQSPMAVEEFQFILDSINKGLPLEKRVGLQFRNANPIPATHFRPSWGEQNGLHGPIPKAPLDIMITMQVSWPYFKQHEPYRKDYQLTTVREVQSTGLKCKDDGSDLPSNFFPVPIQMLRQDLVLQVTRRSLFRLDIDVSSHRSCKALSDGKGGLKRIPQQYSNDHPQLINSLTLRQSKEAPKVTQTTRSKQAAERDFERRPPGVGTNRSYSASAGSRSSAPTKDRRTTTNAPWSNFVSSTAASSSTTVPTGPAPKAMPRAASAAGDRAQPTPEPPARPVRPAADAMINYLSKPKAPPCPVVVAAAFQVQASVNVNQRHSSQAMEVDKDDRVPMNVPPIPSQQGPTSFYAPIPPPIM